MAITIGVQRLAGTTLENSKKYPSKEGPNRGGLEFKAANQCSDFLNQFKKSPDALCTSNRLGGDAKKAKEENAL